jgi:large subunit ribosomal protein L24
MRKIRKGDKVQVTTGKDKGRTGTILQVLTQAKRPKVGLMVIVEGMNVKKKHVKPNPQKEQPGGIVPKEAPMPACNVALIDPTTNKASRVGIKVLADGQKVRYFKSSGEVVDV